MKTKKELTCIGCPMGCPITVELNGAEIVSIEGYTCPRGKSYAAEECTHPSRIVTTTVPVDGGTLRAAPVKTAGPVPKDAVFACIRELRGFRVKAPVAAGQVLRRNLAGTGVDFVATKSVPENRETP